jgi:membrane protein YqaA with SNARE-associated domain
MAVFIIKLAKCDHVSYIRLVKKIKVNPRSLFKILSAFILFGSYWYFVNQKLVSESTSQLFGLTGLFVLISFSTAFFPLPANLLVLGAVKNNDPLAVSLVAGAGTLVAYLLEYIFFTLLFRFQKVASFKNTWLYQTAAPLFDQYKFFILTFASFLPIPSEPLRIYAITSRYSRAGYAFAGLVGRIPRYFLLGYFGKDYVNSIWFIVGVILFPAVFLLIIRLAIFLYHWLRGGLPQTSAALPLTVAPNATETTPNE